MKQVRDAHAKWDRSRRDWEAVRDLSSQCDNTKGCKFEGELEGLLAQGKEIDGWMVSLEKKGIVNYHFTARDAEAIKAKNAELKTTIKKGQDRMHALNAWLKIK